MFAGRMAGRHVTCHVAPVSWRSSSVNVEATVPVLVDQPGARALQGALKDTVHFARNGTP